MTTAYSVHVTGVHGNLVAQANEWCREITYRPDWRFSVVDEGFNTGAPAVLGVNLVIDAIVTDSDEGVPVKITHRLPIHPEQLRRRETFLDSVLTMVAMVEVHEAMEFFKVVGERWQSPHTPDRVRYAVDPFGHSR